MSSLESFVLISRKVEVACYKLSKNKKWRKLIETHWTQICILLNRQLPLWFTEDIHWMWSKKYLFSPQKSFLLLFYPRTSPCYIYIHLCIYLCSCCILVSFNFCSLRFSYWWADVKMCLDLQSTTTRGQKVSKDTQI